MRRLLLWTLSAVLMLSSCSVARNSEDLLHISQRRRAGRIVVSKDIDMTGWSLHLPKGCEMVFRGGSISNCALSFDSVTIKGNPKFINCTYKGGVRLKEIDDRDFSSSDDMGTFRFLMDNAIRNGARCTFYRDYRINMNEVSGSGLLSYRDLDSGADILFQGGTVYNTKPFTTRQIKPVLSFRDVRNVTIRNLFFHDADEHNCHNSKNSTGCAFIYCFGDCENINLLDCSQENGDCILRSGVYKHDANNPGLTPRLGLTNSTLRVRTVNTGYGLALYCGDNLDIDVTAMSSHRGFYCAGVSNSRIAYSGYDARGTKCHILIKDAVYRKAEKDGRIVLDMKGCHDLKIHAHIGELLQQETVITFQSYGSGKKENADFTFRSGKCHHYNIDFSADIERYPDGGHYLICNCAGESGSLGPGDVYGCKLSNITIHDVRITGSSRKYLCNVSSTFDADIIVRNCIVETVNKKQEGFNIQVNGDATGRIRVTNSVVGYIIVKDKEKGQFDVEVEGTPIIHGTEFANVKQTKRNLLRIKRD